MIITAEPRSDQWNADDFVQGPHTFTIAGVAKGKAEQKYDIALNGSDRAWRPPITVLRILLAAWGDEASQWVGHGVTLYRDDSVRFGPNEVGGIRVSHLSHIEKPLTVLLGDKRGSRKKHVIQPLTTGTPTRSAAPVRDWLHELYLAGDDMAALAALGQAASTAHAPEVAAIAARYNELKGTA